MIELSSSSSNHFESTTCQEDTLADSSLLIQMSVNIREDESKPLQSTTIDVKQARIATMISYPSARDASTLAHARKLLYVSHLFAQFSEAAWQFSLILFLAAVSDYQSLILVSTYGMTSFAIVCWTGARIGHFVDSSNRLFAARLFIWAENMGVMIATVLCYTLLYIQKDNSLPPKPEPDAPWSERYFYGVPTDLPSIFLLLGIHIFGPLAQMFDRGFLVAIERDWIVVMSEGDAHPKDWLSSTNVTLKQIDLACKIVAPAVAGFIIGSFGKGDKGHGDLTGAAILVGVLNVLSLLVEYVCTARIYELLPTLATKTLVLPSARGDHIPVATDENDNNDDDNNDDEVVGEKVNPQQQNDNHPVRLCCVPYGMATYLKQPIAWGGLGLAMLYVNALTFGGLMTAFLVWKGMSLETVGIWRGVSSGLGLLGTFVYQFSSKHLTIVQTGQWSILYLFGCLSLCFVSFFVDSYFVSMCLLIVGTCASRIGLWVFDISVTQLMQEFVPDGIRGLVGGTQQALNALFQLFSFSLGLVFPNPREFYIFAAAGYISIGTAMILYTIGVGMKSQYFRMPNEL